MDAHRDHPGVLDGRDQVVRRFGTLDWDTVHTGTLTVKVVSAGKKAVIDGVLVRRGPLLG